MNIEISPPNIHENDESAENETGLDDTKSNGFLYVDINDYNENDLDGIEIKEEEEEVEDITLEKNGIEADELYFEENLPLNSLKNLVNHSQDEVQKEICIKNKRAFPNNKAVLKENISFKGQVIDDCEESSNLKRYKLRTRTLTRKVASDLIENANRKKHKKLHTGKKTVCTECGGSFSSRNKFLKHKAEKTDFECLNCKKCFCTAALLDTHVKLCENHESVQFGCKKYWYQNGEIFSQENNLENYKETFYKCDRCSRSFTKKKNLLSHILKNDCSYEIYTCAFCEETFIKKTSLKKHIIAHLMGQLQHQFCFDSLNNQCCISDINSESVSQNSSSNGEPKTHLDEGINCRTAKFSKLSRESTDKQPSKVSCSTLFKCSFCKKIYKGVATYEKHLKSHKEDLKHDLNNSSNNRAVAGDCQKPSTGKKKIRYECDTCGKGFLKLVKLKIHILNIHQGINYQCQKCNTKFSNHEDLNTHMNDQSCKSEISTCKTCGKVFAKRDYLKKHQYMHMNVLFKCKYCYCAFMKEKSYKRHMEKMNCSKSARKIRMSEFNYKKCRICEVKYESEELLISHFKVAHVGLEPHQCFCCDSCLPTFQDLQNHIHQHNIQKYTCNLCGKPYTSQEGFRKHRLKHKGAEFKCKFCESEFLNESRYKFHEKTCKKNPDTGYEPSQEKEKPKKKNDKPKQSRQLHWESRIIMKRLRGDPKSLSGEQKSDGGGQLDSNIASTFFDDTDTDADERGWFNSYYKTEEDDIAFGLKKADEATSQDCDSDFDVSEFLQTGPVTKKKKVASTPNNVPNTVSTAGENELDTGMDQYSSSSSEDSSSEDSDVKDTDLPIDYNPKKCRLCNVSFSQEYELLHHFIKTHPRQYAHKCPQCEVQSPLYAQLREHLKTHGIGIGIFNCDNCSKQFKSEKKMNSHNIRCKGINNKTYDKKSSQSGDESCKRCGKKFHTKFGYRRHKQLCRRKKNKDKTSTNAVKASVKEEAVADNLTEFQISDGEADEEISKGVHDKPVPEKNVTVGEKSADVKSQGEEKSKNEAKVNYAGEPPIDSFPCRLCDKKFQYERGIVMHFKSAHPGNKPLICHVCNMHLADKLKEHLKTHGIGEEFVCELCGKRFNQKFLSKIHEMWHEGVEYKCNNCKQKFLNKEKMEKHIGENRCRNRQSLMRLPCDICGKSYRSKFGLSKHYITHTPKELRPVKNRMNCEFCGKWFEYNNGLQRHRRIHTGERPFCCRFCPKAFAQEGNCKAHERIHTGEPKPRKKKVSAAALPPAISTPQLPPVSSQVVPPAPAIDTISYPGHINMYIYNSADPNVIVH